MVPVVVVVNVVVVVVPREGDGMDTPSQLVYEAQLPNEEAATPEK